MIFPWKIVETCLLNTNFIKWKTRVLLNLHLDNKRNRHENLVNQTRPLFFTVENLEKQLFGVFQFLQKLGT
jgi:hypothetical protein